MPPDPAEQVTRPAPQRVRLGDDERVGYSVEEILEGLPDLTPAQVYEASSYYHDHVEEVEQDIEASSCQRVIERYGLTVAEDSRIVAPDSGG